MIELKLLEEKDGNILFPIEKTFSIMNGNQEINRITLGINPNGQVKLRKSPYKLISFDRSVGQWNLNALSSFVCILYDEAIAFQKELSEILQIIEYLNLHEEILR